MKRYNGKEIENLKDKLDKDMNKIAKKHGIVFVYGLVLESTEKGKSHFLGTCATGKDGMTRYDLIDCFESASRLYQTMRHSMRERLDHIFK